MQDLSRYKKRDTMEISTRYISPIVAGIIIVTGLVFATGVLVGSRNRPGEPCPEPDLLSKLNEQSGEPAPPGEMEPTTYHARLALEQEKIPVPASLRTVDDAAPDMTEAEELAAVTLETPRGDEEPVLEKIRDEEAGVFTLQVGSFQDQREASLMVQRLKKAGHNSFLVRVSMPGEGGTWYRVRVGPFHSKKEAWTYKDDFESRERLPAFVVKRRG